MVWRCESKERILDGKNVGVEKAAYQITELRPITRSIGIHIEQRYKHPHLCISIDSSIHSIILE